MHGNEYTPKKITCRQCGREEWRDYRAQLCTDCSHLPGPAQQRQLDAMQDITVMLARRRKKGGEEC